MASHKHVNCKNGKSLASQGTIVMKRNESKSQVTSKEAIANHKLEIILNKRASKQGKSLNYKSINSAGQHNSGV